VSEEDYAGDDGYCIDGLYDVKVADSTLLIKKFSVIGAPHKRAYVESVAFNNKDAATQAQVSRLIAIFFAPQDQRISTVIEYLTLVRKQVMVQRVVPGIFTYNADSGRGWRVPMTGNRAADSRWDFYVAAAASPGVGLYSVQLAFYSWGSKP
jgi:hypothetical protein